MKSLLFLLNELYAYLLRLYPNSYRKEFAEEMLLDFSDMVTEASRKGKRSLIGFCLRELIDFPVNLVRIHIGEGYAFKILRSVPINHALRGALGYGIVFGLAILIGEFVDLKLFIEENSIVGNLQVFYYDLFHTEHGLEFISWIPYAIASLLSGLVLGILFAVLFADRSKYGRYILAGMLGWFLHDAITSILWQSANLGFFLGTKHTYYLSKTESVLSGAFLAFTFIAAKSEKREPMRLLVIGSFAYPLIAYFYAQVLFKLYVIETPWMFVALMVLMIAYIGSVVIMTLRSGLERKTAWTLVAGILIYQFLPYAMQAVVVWVSLLIPFPVLPATGALVGSPLAWRFIYRLALDNAIFGMIFGLMMGLIFGLQKKNDSPQLTA